jgi:hypothetical protein
VAAAPDPHDGLVRHIACLLVLTLTAALVASPASAEDPPAEQDWYAAAVEAKELDPKHYEKRISEILTDVNATRAAFCGLGELTWDKAASEGHFRHARWLVHHMREPWNSGGVKDFHDEEPNSELFHLEGRAAAKISVIAFKYIRGRKPFTPSENWLPTVIHRFPWMTRSAEKALPEGAEFEGRRWGIVVMSTDADYTRSRARDDARNDEPVLCPHNGAEDVPLKLQREVPDVVPKALDMDGTKKRELGFPITFSFFGGQDVYSGADVTLVKLEQREVKKDDDEERRPPPGKRRKKKKPKKEQKKEYETIETPLACHVSSPRFDPLRENPRWNSNSVVAFPHEPLEPSTTYRATLRVQIADGGEPELQEFVTTFTTASDRD